MGNNNIIALIKYATPILSLSLIALLLVFKLYRRIRTYFKILVNCWFCNVNCKVPFELYNRWICPHCEQYNGFTEDGDYNRDISAQRELKLNNYNIGGPTKPLYNFSLTNNIKPENGLCNHCNEKQEHKIEKIAQFEPENEDNFDEELAEFKKTLEDLYKPCIACQNNILKILTEKKKIILGSKLASLPRERNFFDLELRKYIAPKVQKNQQALKNTFSVILFTFACINFMNITHKINLNSKNFNVAQSLPFDIITHLVALTRAITNIFLDLFKMKLIEKSILYIKTIATLISYTLNMNINFFNIRPSIDFESGIPFGAICLTLVLILLSKFKNNQYLMLLVLWSFNEIPIKCFADELYALDIIKFLTSIAIIGFSIPRRDKSENAKYCLDTTTESFHRIYSEDYLSQSNNNHNTSNKLSSSSSSSFTNKNISLNTTISNRSFANKSLGSDIFHNTTTSSVYALNNSPESAFKKYHFDDTSSQILNRSHIIKSPTNNNQNFSRTLFLSNTELNHVPQPLSPTYSLNNITNQNSDHFHNIKPSTNHHHFNGIPCSSPLNRAMTSCSSELFRRQNIISPSRFNNTLNTNNSYQQVYASPQSWVSGGYFNNQKQQKENTNNKSCYLNKLTSITENESRASSQSSGFESQEGSGRNCDNENYSRESSFCPDIDRWSVCSIDPTFVPQDFKSYSQQSIINGTAARCISPALVASSMVAAPSLIFSNTNNMNLTPSSPRSQSIQSIYVDSNTNNCSTNYVGDGGFGSSEPQFTQKIHSSKSVNNMFEFNSLYHVLPPIQRGSLLKKWREQTST